MISPRTGLALWAACAVLLALPVAAEGSCGCLAWSRGYVAYPAAQDKLDSYLRFYSFGSTRRARIRQGIYDYAKDGYVSNSFCTTYPKVCRAVKACIAAAGVTYVTAKVAGATNKTATISAVGTCVQGILSVYLVA